MATGLYGSAPEPGLEGLRGKVDDRLHAILSLGSERVHQLRRRELAALRDLAAELGALDASVLHPDDLRKRSAAIWKRVAPPFTAGVHFPGEQRGLPSELVEKKEPILSVFVQTEISATDLVRHGFTMRSRSGSVCTAWVGWSSLMAIGAVKGVQRVELARALKPSSPYPLTETGLEAIHTAATPHKGTGVLIGVADRYLDILHPDFQELANSGTRVQFLWDQHPDVAGPGNSPSVLAAGDITLSTAGLVDGVEYTKADIDATIVNAAGGVFYTPVRHKPPRRIHQGVEYPDSSAVDSHGTLVAGAALGNGKASQAQALGIPSGAAPEAQLIFVHLCPDDITEWMNRPGLTVPTIALTETTHVANAATYAFARAERLGMPCVLNLSLGESLGGHDGGTSLERSLDALVVGPGRALVVSAGNEEDAQAHLAGNAPPDPLFQFTVSAGNTLPAEIQIWSKAAMPLGITLHGPSGQLALAAGALHASLGGGGAPEVHLYATAASATHPANCISILLIPGATVPPAPNDPGTYTVNLSANGVAGRFHVWSSHLQGGVSLTQPTGGVTVAPPATAAHAIVAGAWNPNVNGVLTDYSGRGPARHQEGVAGAQVLPDLCAPTDFYAPTAVDRAFLAQYLTAHPGYRSASYAGLTGTSAAAPLVSGAAALLMECSLHLATWADVKRCLRSKATSMTGGVPDNSWGHGKLAAANVCACPITEQVAPLPEWAGVPETVPIEERSFEVPRPGARPGLIRVELEVPGASAGIEVLRAPGLDGLEIELPLAALPLHSEEVLAGCGYERPLLGEAGDFQALAHFAAELEGPEVLELFEVGGALRATIGAGRVRIVCGERLSIPRLRVRPGTRLPLACRVLTGPARSAGQLLCVRQFEEGAWKRALIVGLPGPG